MSNHLAFAHVTAVLRDLLGSAIKDVNPGADSLARVDRPDAVAKDFVGVNVFLYQFTPNPAWRNADLPTRRPNGTIALRPQAAFDLHYLLSFHGTDDKYEPQRILGTVVSLLHSQPVLSPEIVAAAAKGDLAASNLAEQVERVRLTPLPLTLEELAKLWSVFFQVPYKLSVAYQASVVLVEPDVVALPALPVREPHVDVVTMTSKVIAS